jgi:hypothetical protein
MKLCHIHRLHVGTEKWTIMAGHMTQARDKRIQYRNLMGKLKERDCVGDLDIDGMLILK